VSGENLVKPAQLANLAYGNTKYKLIRNEMFLTTPLTTWRDHFRTRTSHYSSALPLDMNIAWAYFLSAGLTLTLISGLALLYFPELFPTHLLKRWAQHFHYFGH
jgi:hypothetical protein